MTKISWYRNSFALFPPDYPVDIIERSLQPLGEAIHGCGEIIRKAEELGDEQYINAVIDDETEYIETLLGTAFVLCQTYITFVVSRVKRLHASCEKNIVKLTTSDGSKQAIMQLESNEVDGTKLTEVQIIDAFANYFKHRDEWEGKWADLKVPSSKTVGIIQTVGAQQFSSGNLRTAAEALGIPGYEKLYIFSEILRAWGLGVHNRYDKELESLGLIEK